MRLQAFSPSVSGDEARPAPLRIDICCPDADTLVVTPTGEADLCTAADLRQALSEATAAGRSHIVVDLDQLTFLDASTLGVLVEARLRAGAAGETLTIRCRTRHGLRLLSITALDGMLDHRAWGLGR